ncbi:hypothetical protein ACFYNM_21790 [Streptomyces spororaveus]|uniref:hypothetical protein n=1 Tax=Streptomyces spororaveus TaxID=284039 RepID=UPI0036CDABC0
MPTSPGEEPSGDRVQGLGQQQRGVAQPQRRLRALSDHRCDRQLGDHTDGLGVKQDEETGEPILDGEGVVVHETPADRPAFVFVGRPNVALLLAGRDLQILADVPVLAAPLDEAAGAVSGRGPAVYPLVQVALSAEAERGVLLAQPDQQGNGGEDG